MCYSLANNEHKNTKVRLCCNSSFKVNENPSLNECMLDGPQYLNNMDSILTRWRFFQFCGYSDITTAYHKILSNKKDQALRKIWVKKENFGKEYNEPWIVAYPKALQFGDKLAGSFCQLAIFDCAERFMIPENAQQLKENILMDDILIGADSMDILTNKIVDIDQGLKQGDLSVKEWIVTGQDTEPIKYLSYIYHPKTDEFSPRININWSKIKRGARSGPPLEKIEDIKGYMQKFPITKKGVASLVMGLCHDPLGIVNPYINNFKFLYSDICKKDIEWCQEIDSDMKNKITKFISLLFGIEKFRFPRRVAFIEATAIEVLFYFDGLYQV